MMKKLLLCSTNCQEDGNGAAHGDEDNEVDSDDADVIVEFHQENSHSLKSFCRQVETLENLNFNYDVIVKFVKQGKLRAPGPWTGLAVTLSLCNPTLSGMREFPSGFPYFSSQNRALQ